MVGNYDEGDIKENIEISKLLFEKSKKQFLCNTLKLLIFEGGISFWSILPKKKRIETFHSFRVKNNILIYHSMTQHKKSTKIVFENKN